MQSGIIWVRKKIIKHKFITNFWFRKGKYIGYIGRLNEEKKRGGQFSDI